MDTAVDVQLLTHTPDPIRVMYVAFRTCYSKFTPQQLWADIESGKISEEKMKTFIFDKLKSGHSSPRTQVYFTFAVSGLSRAASHQLVRHNNGITFDQQSQRYYAFKEADFPYVVPETWERAGLRDEYVAFMRRVGRPLSPAQRGLHEPHLHRELRGVPARRRPASLLAGAVGDPAHVGQGTECAEGELSGTGEAGATEVWRPADGLLRRASRRVPEVPARCSPDPFAQRRNRRGGEDGAHTGVNAADGRRSCLAGAQPRVREGPRRKRLAERAQVEGLPGCSGILCRCRGPLTA